MWYQFSTHNADSDVHTDGVTEVNIVILTDVDNDDVTEVDSRQSN